MANKVTIQDIADALGLSRNTVSKAINNTGVLAESTKERVLQKAREMGYKTFSYTMPTLGREAIEENSFPSSPGNSKREVAIFSGMFLDNSHFATTMLDKLQYELSLLGYSMTMHRVMEENLREQSLPFSFHPETTAAILCVEIFYFPYCKMLSELDLPLLLVDAPVNTYASPLPADLLLMENASGIFRIIKKARQRGLEKIGFVGQPTHCRSFFERFMAFREAMQLYGLPIQEELCLTEVHPHGAAYQEYLRKEIKERKDFPDLFICANDFVALDLLNSLKEKGISCPEDIYLTGFDDAPLSRVITPPLTTCHIHSQIMGLSAVHMITTRIRQPDLHYRTMHTETELIYRESTRKEFAE